MGLGRGSISYCRLRCDRSIEGYKEVVLVTVANLFLGYHRAIFFWGCVEHTCLDFGVFNMHLTITASLHYCDNRNTLYEIASNFSYTLGQHTIKLPLIFHTPEIRL